MKPALPTAAAHEFASVHSRTYDECTGDADTGADLATQ